MLANQAVQCLPLSVLFLSLSIRLSFTLWRDITQILKMNCCLSLLIYPLLFSLSLSVSLSLSLPHTLFLLVKTESILESENRLRVSAPFRSLLDKGIESPLLLLRLLAFLESFTQLSTFCLFFFFPFGGCSERGFSLFLVLVSCMISILLLFMSQGWRSREPDIHQGKGRGRTVSERLTGSVSKATTNG